MPSVFFGKLVKNQISQGRHNPEQGHTRLYKVIQATKKIVLQALYTSLRLVAQTFLSAVPQTFQSASRTNPDAISHPLMLLAHAHARLKVSQSQSYASLRQVSQGQARLRKV